MWPLSYCKAQFRVGKKCPCTISHYEINECAPVFLNPQMSWDALSGWMHVNENFGFAHGVS